MTEAEREELIIAWIELYKHRKFDSFDGNPNFWAFIKLDEICKVDAELCWDLILGILEKDKSDMIFQNLAAGPLEDFLVEHGEMFIDRVEVRAKADANFQVLLGGVWQNEMSYEIWSRVSKAAAYKW